MAGDGSLSLLAGLDVGQRPADRPNVVLIISDDQGWGDFGFMGSTSTHTPNLDKLASQSAVFPNGYVPTSLCRASLATLLTGLYAHQAGMGAMTQRTRRRSLPVSL